MPLRRQRSLRLALLRGQHSVFAGNSHLTCNVVRRRFWRLKWLRTHRIIRPVLSVIELNVISAPMWHGSGVLSRIRLQRTLRRLWKLLGYWTSIGSVGCQCGWPLRMLKMPRIWTLISPNVNLTEHGKPFELRDSMAFDVFIYFWHASALAIIAMKNVPVTEWQSLTSVLKEPKKFSWTCRFYRICSVCSQRVLIGCPKSTERSNNNQNIRVSGQ